MYRTTIAFVIGLALAGSPALAGTPDEATDASTTRVEKTVSPTPERPARLSTTDRWRGKPYVASTAGETIRAQALDKALPPANPVFQGGVSLGF